MENDFISKQIQDLLDEDSAKDSLTMNFDSLDWFCDDLFEDYTAQVGNYIFICFCFFYLRLFELCNEFFFTETLSCEFVFYLLICSRVNYYYF